MLKTQCQGLMSNLERMAIMNKKLQLHRDMSEVYLKSGLDLDEIIEYLSVSLVNAMITNQMIGVELDSGGYNAKIKLTKKDGDNE